MRNPRYLAIGLLAAAFLSMGSAMAWADDGSIVLDFVRHGESGDMTVVNTLVPGPDLTDTGEQQAQALVNAMSGNGIDDIYASTMIRSQETAAPLAEALHLPINVLSGLNEIDAGIFEGIPVNVGDLPLGGALYLLAPLAWTLGLDFVPQLGSTVDPNGVAFDESFSGAVQSIYDGTVGTYRQTSLTAFQEVEDNLAALRILENEAQQQDEAVASAKDSLHLFTNRYKGGVDTYLQVITAETIELANELNAIDILRRRMDASVLLVKALSGGWDASKLPTFGAHRVKDY